MATSTAARRKATVAAKLTKVLEDAPEWRVEMVEAINRLNHQQHRMGWWTPTELQHELTRMRLERAREGLHRELSETEEKELQVSRSTVGMRLGYMRAEQIVAFESLINAGAIAGTPGFRYGVIGTPPSGDARVVENEAELERRALELARDAATAASLHKPKRRTKSRVAEGRVPVTTTANAHLWQRVQQRVLARGIPKAKVLDTILERYLADESAASSSERGPARATRYLPRSQPTTATA